MKQHEMDFDLTEKKIQIRVWLSEEQLGRIEVYQRTTSCISRSETIRRLIDQALKQNKIK